MVADDIIPEIPIPNTRWVFLSEQQGFADLQRQANEGSLELADKKLVVLITGCAEVVAQHHAIINCVQSALEAIQKENPDAIILICAPMPRPRDGPVLIAELDELAKVLSDICKRSEYLEFSKLGQNFYAKFRAMPNEIGEEELVYLIRSHLMNSKGLTLHGSRLISARISEKIASAQLLQRFDLLKDRILIRV